MLIGILQLELRIGDALNTRDKQRILRSLKDAWRHHHNVSVAEVDYQDFPQNALLGVAMVGNDPKHLESALSRLVDSLKRLRKLDLIDFRIEIVSGRD